MKRINIDWSMLVLAFDSASDRDFYGESTTYFDQQTGELVFVDHEVSSAASSIQEELDGVLKEGEELTDFSIRATAAFKELSEEFRAGAIAAVHIEYGNTDRYHAVPGFESHEQFEWMRDFVETLSGHKLQHRLSEALEQRKPFRGFRDVLDGDRQLDHKWRAYEAQRERDAIVAWLRELGVEPANTDDQSPGPPPLPDLRGIMLKEVLRFVEESHKIAGVQRIALVGSLASAEEFPQSLELLVTVSDACDLAPLAKLGRRLHGEMLKHQAGANVLLADENNAYLGLTCPWKKCGPGIRASCRALHCGQRHYLYDNLDEFRPQQADVAEPPVVLWPKFAAEEGLPHDIRERLTEKPAADRLRVWRPE